MSDRHFALTQVWICIMQALFELSLQGKYLYMLGFALYLRTSDIYTILFHAVNVGIWKGERVQQLPSKGRSCNEACD